MATLLTMTDTPVITGWHAASQTTGLSCSKLRSQHAAGHLHSERDARGRHLFRVEDLMALPGAVPPDDTPADSAIGPSHTATEQLTAAPAQPQRYAPTPSPAPPEIDGELSAEVFALFATGLGPAEVVVEMRRHPDVIAALHQRYVEMTELALVPAEDWRAIKERAGIHELSEVLGILMRMIAAESQLDALSYDCSVCHTPARVDAVEDMPALIENGAFDEFGHRDCIHG